MATAFPELARKQSATSTDVRISWQMMQLTVSLVPQRRPNSRKDTETRMVCPQLHEHTVPVDPDDPDGETVVVPVRVNEFYICPAGHKGTRGEMLSAREIPGATDDDEPTLVIVDKEAKAAAVGGDQPEKELNLIAVPRDQLDSYTRPDEAAVRVRLDKKPSATDRKLYAAYRALAADGEMAMVGTMTISGKRRLYVLSVWNDQLILESRIETADLAPPDELDVPDAGDAEIAPLVAKFREAMHSTMVDFDADDFRHDAKGALDALAAAVANGDAPPVTAGESGAGVDDLLAALDSVVQSTTKKKATKKDKAAAA